MSRTDNGSYRLVFRPEGELLAATRGCELEVFHRTYGNSAEQFAEEYGPYEASSVFLALVHDTEAAGAGVVGACRLIAPGPAGLKTVDDVGRAPWHADGPRAVRAAGADPAHTWDVATLAVLPHRGVTALASAALYHGLVLATRANDVRWIVMMLDSRARRLLSMVGFVPQTMPGTWTAGYLGSAATTPLIGNVAGMIDAQRRRVPDAYRLISLGVGLDGIAVPGTAGFALTTGAPAASPPAPAPRALVPLG